MRKVEVEAYISISGLLLLLSVVSCFVSGIAAGLFALAALAWTMIAIPVKPIDQQRPELDFGYDGPLYCVGHDTWLAIENRVARCPQGTDCQNLWVVRHMRFPRTTTYPDVSYPPILGKTGVKNVDTKLL